MPTNKYKIGELRLDRPKYAIYLAESIKDQRPLLVKSYYPTQASQDLDHLAAEYALLKKLEGPYVIKALAIESDHDSPRIVLEHPPGRNLGLISNERFSLEQFLFCSIALVKAVQNIHNHSVVHKNICPAHIYYDEEHQSVQLAGFEISNTLGRDALHVNANEFFQADLTYVSPEQTGRVNHSLDQRTDLYSLGIVFFEWLAGHPPFSSDDPLELIHAHLAKAPKDLSQTDSNIPSVLSDIIDILLSKNPEDRYQTTGGLLHDLQKCADQYRTSSTISAFTLKEHDLSSRFSLSQKLYGRSEEIDQLIKSYEKTKVGGAIVHMVTGASGLGKSALVKVVERHIDQDQGFFISGKFDQFKDNAPMSSLLQAFSDLIRQLMMEGDQKIQEWQSKILDAVGNNGKILIDVIPDLELLIGSQPEVVDLPLTEATNRFNQVFDRFVNVFAQHDHPLCIFLDDLQWIDATTRRWLEGRLISRQFNYLLIIGAYRDGQVTESHPIMLMMDALRQNDIDIQQISLRPLTQDDITQLIGDSLSMDSEGWDDLAELVFQKTGGNPFFIRQLLLSLYENGGIYFSTDRHEWQTDLEKVRAAHISDNVVELMTDLLHRLPDDVLATLKMASCIGNQFDSYTLSHVCDQDTATTATQLAQTIKLGLIIPKGTQSKSGASLYNFQHDKIQQAAFSLFDEEDKLDAHLVIGRYLLDRADQNDSSEHIYEIKYSTKAMELIPAATWEEPSDLTRRLYLQRAEADHLCGNDDLAEEYFEKAISHAQNEIERAKISQRQIQYYNNLGKFEKAYETGRIAVQALGVNLPAKFVPPILIKDTISYRLLRGRRKIQDLIHVKEMEDERLKMAVLLMSTFARSAYQIRPELCVSVAARIVKLCLKHGNTDGVFVGYLAFGSIFHGAILKLRKSGYDFGQLTLALIEKYKSLQFASEANFVIGYFATPWLHPATEMERQWQFAYDSGLEVGDHFHASCAACGTIQSYFMRGVSFEDTLQTASRFLAFIKNIKYTEGVLTVQAVIQAIKNIQGQTASKVSYTNDDFDENDFEIQLEKFGARHLAHYYLINKMRTLYQWGAYDEAKVYADRSDEYLKDSPGMLHTAEHYFYRGLVLSSLCEHDSQNKKRWLKELGSINKRFKKYAKGCLSNFIHKSQILDAEYAAASGEINQSRDLYYKAVESAKTYSYAHIKALANQRLVDLYLHLENMPLASFHLQEAIYDYKSIDAHHYAEYLIHKHDDVSIRDVSALSTHRAQGAPGIQHANFQNLDLTTILKSSEAISREVRLKDLLSTMMNIIIENAGAQRMVLLLKEGDQLMVQAECMADNQDIQILDKVPVNDYPSIAQSVVNYVYNTGEPVILDSAHDNDTYGNDGYIASQKIRSLLCSTISKQGTITGVIYLENNLATNVFTQDKIDLIILLSGQIATSINNAQLYDNLEEKIYERTKELNLAKEKSDELLQNILPVDIAQEIKIHGFAKPRLFNQVTIMFADFQNFSQICEKLGTDQLVEEINYFYTVFDKIIGKHKIEKIKTIGDCYMCAGSIPNEEDIHPHPTLYAAIDIQEFMKQERQRRENTDKLQFDIRIGLHTGPVVAGVVGLRKFAYDIWGDAVNIASRMESNGEIGKINISEVLENT